jgi:predicted ferric reductase
VYAVDRIEDLAYGAELDDLARHLPLHLVRVLRDAPPEWDGERGFVDAALLDRHLTSDAAATWHVFLCGPPPMMDVAERAVRNRGVPLHRIHSERFDIGAAGAVGQRSIQVRRLVTGLSLMMLTAAALFAW